MEHALDRLSEIKPSSAKKIEIYAQRCYHDFMNPAIIDWWQNNRDDKDIVRAITRPFYDLVHACSIPTGLITKTAFEKLQSNKKFIATKDHCFRPQNTYHFMLDNRESFCEFSTFRKWYVMCCSTILVVGKENDRLSLEVLITDADHMLSKFLQISSIFVLVWIYTLTAHIVSGKIELSNQSQI
jgi:hypothetical protein